MRKWRSREVTLKRAGDGASPVTIASRTHFDFAATKFLKAKGAAKNEQPEVVRYHPTPFICGPKGRARERTKAFYGDIKGKTRWYREIFKTLVLAL